MKFEYGEKVNFILAGKIDLENSSSIPKEQLEKWNLEGNVTWIGHQDDIVPLIRNTHIVVLPSYREGLPKVLIEACAIGRPIITTDVPGCREIVQSETNGILIKKVVWWTSFVL
ncbi:MAG: glycosyltransferase [Saprospiraceae bacterium]|nr:glycosyltransferase [Saprospiraceae bacterium]